MKKLFLFTFIVFLFSCKQSQCKTIVKLNSGEVITAEYVQTFVSGVSNIKKCNGDDFQINTNDIEEIIQK